jgi:hypothetical protein
MDPYLQHGFSLTLRRKRRRICAEPFRVLVETRLGEPREVASGVRASLQPVQESQNVSVDVIFNILASAIEVVRELLVVQIIQELRAALTLGLVQT